MEINCLVDDFSKGIRIETGKIIHLYLKYLNNILVSSIILSSKIINLTILSSYILQLLFV